MKRIKNIALAGLVTSYGLFLVSVYVTGSIYKSIFGDSK